MEQGCEDKTVSSEACDELLIGEASEGRVAGDGGCGQDITPERICNGIKRKSSASNAACENLDLLKCYIRDKLFSDSPYGNEFLAPDLVNGSFSCCVNNNIINSFTSSPNQSISSNNSCDIGAKDKRRNVSVVNINYNECDDRDHESTGARAADQLDHPDLLRSHPELDGELNGPLRGDRRPDFRDLQCGPPSVQFDPSHNHRVPQAVHMNGHIPEIPEHSTEPSGNLVSHVYTNGALNNINIDVPSFESESATNGHLDPDDDEESFNSCSGSMTSMLDDDVIDSILTEEEKSVREKIDLTKNEEIWTHQNNSLESDLIVDFLDKSNNHAEARLAARRQARAEAREIRMRELERQQREAEENADKVFDLYATTDVMNRTSRVGSCIASPRSASVLSTGGGNNSYHSSRRSSEDSLEESIGVRDMRHELRDVEDRFRKAMIQNAQLDNEKSAVSYQVELFKDKFEELEESHAQLQREHRDKCREHEQLKRLFTKMQGELEFFKLQLEERDSLIKGQGLVIVGGECSSEDERSDEGPRGVNGLENGLDSCNSVNNHSEKKKVKKPAKRALVSVKAAELLDSVGEGSLDVRLRKLAEERNELLDELRHVKLELEEERGKSRGYKSMNGTDGGLDFEDVQREANKLLGEYKFKWQKAEQDVSTLQANVARLESQVIRYKSAAETSEKVEDELKVEKRKLQRELREAQSRVEELETSNMHLQRRLDKLKNAKSTLLKEL